MRLTGEPISVRLRSRGFDFAFTVRKANEREARIRVADWIVGRERGVQFLATVACPASSMTRHSPKDL